jgi:hypothetical protein
MNMPSIDLGDLPFPPYGKRQGQRIHNLVGTVPRKKPATPSGYAQSSVDGKLSLTGPLSYSRDGCLASPLAQSIDPPGLLVNPGGGCRHPALPRDTS